MTVNYCATSSAPNFWKFHLGTWFESGSPIRQKSTNWNSKCEKAACETFVRKSCMLNVGEIEPRWFLKELRANINNYEERKDLCLESTVDELNISNDWN